MPLGRSHLIAAVLTAGVGSALFGWIADRAGNAAPGAVAGAVIGAGLGYGVASGYIGPTAIGAVIGAICLAIIGPGYDDYAGIGSVQGAILGGFIGWLLFGRSRMAVAGKSSSADSPGRDLDA